METAGSGVIFLVQGREMRVRDLNQGGLGRVGLHSLLTYPNQMCHLECGRSMNIGALIIGVGFWGILSQPSKKCR